MICSYYSEVGIEELSIKIEPDDLKCEEMDDDSPEAAAAFASKTEDYHPRRLLRRSSKVTKKKVSLLR